MDIKFNGQFDKPTFFKAVSLANQQSQRSLIIRYVLIGIAAIFLVINVFNFFARGGQNSNDILSVILSIIIVLYFVFGTRLTTYTLANRLWKGQGVHQPQSGTINEEGIIYHPDTTVVAWERYGRGQSAEDMQLLLTDDGLLSIFPRSFFDSDEDWKTFRNWVETRIPTKK
jgi:hypothetical protein